MITLKSHSKGRKPETIIEGECEGLRDREARSMSICASRDGARCVSCVRLTQGRCCLGWTTLTIGKITQCGAGEGRAMTYSIHATVNYPDGKSMTRLHLKLPTLVS